MTDKGILRPEATLGEPQFRQELGLFDATMVVVGVMIGSGIFIVSADMSRLIGSPAWLLVAWLIAGLITIAGALCYGELAGMMPHAGGMYIYLRESLSPIWGFLYGWTLFTVIQTGTIAAVAVAFGRFFGVLCPVISDDKYIIGPVHLSTHYALSLSTVQLLAILLVALLTSANTYGLSYGRAIQNVSSIAKIGTLFALIILGIGLGSNITALHANFVSPWSRHGFEIIAPGLTAGTTFGLIIALCLSQSGSLFASEAWHNIAFAAAEVKNARRNVTLAMVIGTVLVILLYLLANVAYLVTLPLPDIQHAPVDRVATATLQVIFPGIGTSAMAVAIMVSTFGAVNALVMTGARVYYAMACEHLFFPATARLNKAHVPARSLLVQGAWAMLLVLPRTYNPVTGKYGNVYSNLLDYVISAVLLFYILTVLGLFRLRFVRPNADRPYRTAGYPVVPALHILCTSTILVALLAYRPTSSWPGLVIILLGVPVYSLLRWANKGARTGPVFS
ncbi:MAG: APC family permease [Candidatus Dormibacteria bacterium]